MGSDICAFDWYQNHRPWMTLNCHKFKFSRNFLLLCILRECHSECRERLVVIGYQGCHALTLALARLEFISVLEWTAIGLYYGLQCRTYRSAGRPGSGSLLTRHIGMYGHVVSEVRRRGDISTEDAISIIRLPCASLRVTSRGREFWSLVTERPNQASACSGVTTAGKGQWC